jgi:FkbM family methyltransferase
MKYYKDSRIRFHGNAWQKTFILVSSLFLRSPILNGKWFLTSIYLPAYYFYKDRFEDTLAKVLRTHDDFLGDGHFLDVGGAMGFSAITVEKYLKDPFKIYCFEPETENFKILEWVVQRKDLSHKVTLLNKAVGASDGSSRLWKNTMHRADHRIITSSFEDMIADSDFRYSVPQIQLDTFCLEKDIIRCLSAIKIDVQGYELAVCEGMKRCLSENPDILVVIEYAPESIRELGFNPEGLLEFFRTRDFRFYIYSQKNGFYEILSNSEVDEQAAKTGYLDIFCTRIKMQAKKSAQRF